MTKLTKALVRETAVYERADPLVVELHPRYLVIRVKGDGDGVLVPYGPLYSLVRRRFPAASAMKAR